MGDEFDQYKVSAPAQDEFAQYKTSLPSAASPIAPPSLATAGGRPNQPNSAANMQSVRLLTGNPVENTPPLSQQLTSMAKGTAQNLYDVSAPGIAMSMLQNKFPSIAAKIPLPQAGNLHDLPGKAVTNFALTGEMGSPDAIAGPSVKPTPEVSPSTGPSVGSVLARHIPVIGKYLRTVDDIQALLGKDAPATPTAIAQPKATNPVPETNGIQWGTGGQGPIDLRGKMIPQQESPYQVVKIGGPKQPAVQGADPYLGSRAVMEPAQSTTIAQHGYDPGSRSMMVEFKNGKVYRYSGVPQEVYDAYRNSESQGSFFSQNIKGRYQTDLKGNIPQTAGAKVRQALGGK